MGFVDLHCHVLPGIDDGAKRLEDSLEMLALLRGIGFETVHATPHQRVGFFVPTREAIDGAHAKVAAALPPASPLLHLGAENMWDELFLQRSTDGGIPGYRADGAEARSFLFELPVQHLPPHLEDRLFALRRKGRLPVMAHPERYAPLWDDLPRYEALAQQVALLIDVAALDGAHGRKQCTAARWLVENGLAHAGASDLHGPADARAVAAGIAWIRKRMGDARVARLLSDGPRQILNGELPV